MFNYKIGKLNFVMWQIIYLVLVHLNKSSAECNVCQANQAACINSTSFYLCFGDQQPNRNILYHCKPGFDCTNLNVICVQSSSQRSPSCGDTSRCGMCSAHRNYLFACHSRTTFQMCYGAIRPTGQIGYCPAGYVCDTGSDAVCVLENTVNSVTCDILETGAVTSSPSLPSTTLSPATSTTQNPDNENLKPTDRCKRQRSVGLYPTIPNDPYCKRYIYCFYSNGTMNGIEYSCFANTYFHIQQEKCVFNKPTYCI